MKNIKILFLLFISYSPMKASEESAEFVVNAADSMQSSQALKKIADAQPKKSAAYGSSFVSFFNPSSWRTPADQNNPAVKHLQKIEEAIQDYYDNSKWFNKSTGNTKKQNDAKSEIESLVAQYRKKLDAKDADFVTYKATFEDMIENAQNQFTSLNLHEVNEPLFDSFSDLLAQLNPFNKKQESAQVNNPASKLIAEMEEALSVYYKNTTHPIQYLYQSKDISAAKDKNKAEAVEKFKKLAAQYQAHKDDKDFAPRHDEFKALFAEAQDIFSNENSSDSKHNSPETESMYSQMSKFLTSLLTPSDEKEEKKEEQDKPEHTALNHDAQLRNKIEGTFNTYRKNQASAINPAEVNTLNRKTQAQALQDFKDTVSLYIKTFGTYSVDASNKKYIASKDNNAQAIQGKSDLLKLLELIDDQDHPAFGQHNTSEDIMIPLQRIEHDKDIAAHGIPNKVITENVSLRDIIDFINKR